MSSRGTYKVGLIFNTENEVERLADHSTDDAPIDLARFDEAFQRTRSREGENGQEVSPDGYYDTMVEEVRLSRTQRTGNPMLIWRLRIMSGEFHPRTLSKIRVITEKTLQFLKDDLEQCGVHLERLSDLSLHLDEMFGLKINVMKKTKDQWTDIYFVKVERPEVEKAPF
jgi:hypothetical protein